MPVRDVLVGNAGCHVKHDDTALAVDVVTITETTELLLTSSVPHIEGDVAEVLIIVRYFAPDRTDAVGRGEDWSDLRS